MKTNCSLQTIIIKKKKKTQKTLMLSEAKLVSYTTPGNRIQNICSINCTL